MYHLKAEKKALQAKAGQEIISVRQFIGINTCYSIDLVSCQES